MAGLGRHRNRRVAGQVALAAVALMALVGVIAAILPDARPHVVLRTLTMGQVASAVAVDARTGRAFIAAVDADGDDEGTIDMRSGMLVQTARAGALPSAVAVDDQTQRVFTSAISSAANDMQVDEASGRVIVADATGTGVSAYDGRQGKLLWTGLAGLFVRGVAVDRQRGHVLASAGTGVYVLDARSGATLCAIPLNGTPGGLAIDERAGRAIVVTYQCDKPASDPWDWLPWPLRRWLPHLQQHFTSAPLSSVSVLETTR